MNTSISDFGSMNEGCLYFNVKVNVCVCVCFFFMNTVACLLVDHQSSQVVCLRYVVYHHAIAWKDQCLLSPMLSLSHSLFCTHTHTH